MIEGVRLAAGMPSYLSHKELSVFSGDYVVNMPYRVFRAERFISVPEKYAKCQRFASGALYDEAGKLIPVSKRAGRSMVAECSPDSLMRPFSKELECAPFIKGRSLFLGNWMGHYGHFITEFLSRLWIQESLERFDRIFVAPFIFGRLREIKKLSFHEELLTSLQIDLNRFELLVDPVCFQEVVVPEQGWPVNQAVNAGIRSIYGGCREYFKVENSRPDKIFLTRKSDPAFKRLANLDEINKTFSKAGFCILYPEEMTVDEQLSYYSSCGVMAALSGTLAHNCLFAKKSTRLIELGDLRTKRQLLPMQIAAAQLSEVDYVHINYDGSAGGVWDVKKLAQILKHLDVTG